MIFQLFEDSRGDIWIGGGVARFERKSGRIQDFTVVDENAGLMGTGFAEDRAGNVWVGTYHGSLARYADGRFTMFTRFRGVSRGGWKVPFIDSKGRLWVADDKGLSRSNNPTEATPSFVSYSTVHGLTSNDVKAVTEDLNGNIYVATGRGIDRLNVKDEGIVVTKHYTYADGLAAGELASAYRDRTGSLWFVTTLGISRFTPAPDRPPVLPPVLITGLQVGTAQQPVADVGQPEIQGLRIKPGEGPMRIDFVGLSFAPGESLRYQYQLSGVDKDWSAPTDQRTVVYGRLASGEYHFQVRAINSEGMISPMPAGVVFTMLPPVWQTWWFLLAASLATASLAYAAYRYRIQQLLRVERVRTRIATDLHDDIGSSLSQIAILSELVSKQLQQGDARLSRPLGEIASISREMVGALSDIVWALNPRQEGLADLIARMRRFAFDVLGARGVRLRFESDETDRKPARHASSDFRRQVYLIFKEAVNNVARHAGCTDATVEIRVSDAGFEMHLVDNGHGFNAGSNSGGNGLANMRRRAAELNGTLEIRSNPGGGTELTLAAPLSS
jgi:signal transduction histidine kinase